MQRAMYPSPYMRITQGYQQGTHLDSYAIDEAGSDGGIDYLIAPFDGIVKKIYTQDANEVWLESLEPVLYADGTQDYMTIMFAHDNDVSNLWVGKHIKQGERFYEEGTKGMATGNHVHFECGRGKFEGTGWHQNSAGYWGINNAKKPEECLWLDETYHVLDSFGYGWKYIPKTIGSPVGKDENQDQVEVLVDNLRLRSQPNGDILGYIKKGIYNYSDTVLAEGYWWYKIPEGWIATSTEEGWTIVTPKKEIVVEPIVPEVDEPAEDNKIKEYETKIKELEQKIKELEEKPYKTFVCPRDADYTITLYKDEKLVYMIEK